MVALILEQGEIGRELARRAVAEMPHALPTLVDECKTVGMASHAGHDGRLWGVVLFHGFDPARGIVEASTVSWNPRWATRRTIIDVLSIPFLTYGVRMVMTCTPHRNERALKFNAGIGFKRVATVPHYFAWGDHMVICQMTRGAYDKMVGRFRARAALRAAA